MFSNLSLKKSFFETDENETYFSENYHNLIDQKFQNNQKGKILNVSDFYEYPNKLIKEEEFINIYKKDKNNFNILNKIELKNTTKIQNEKIEEINLIRNIFKNLPFFQKFSFDYKTYFGEVKILFAIKIL